MSKIMMSSIIIYCGICSMLTTAIVAQDQLLKGKTLTPEISSAGQQTGQSWISLNLKNGQITTLAIAPSNPITIYCLTQNKYIFKSTQSGSRWERLEHYPATSNIRTIAIDPTSPDIVYVVQGAG